MQNIWIFVDLISSKKVKLLPKVNKFSLNFEVT